MIVSVIWLLVVIHRSKPRNNALDVFWGMETIRMPLPQHPQKKSFCPMPHSRAPYSLTSFSDGSHAPSQKIKNDKFHFL